MCCYRVIVTFTSFSLFDRCLDSVLTGNLIYNVFALNDSVVCFVVLLLFFHHSLFFCFNISLLVPHFMVNFKKVIFFSIAGDSHGPRNVYF